MFSPDEAAAHFFLKLALAFVVFGGFALQPARAHRSMEMPQTGAFAEAFEKATALASEFPGSRVVTVASTYSMYPLLDWDSLVVIAPVALEQVRVGDIVCFQDRGLAGSRILLHRVERISVKGGRLATRGDHLAEADPHLVFAENLLGRAVYIVYFDRAGEQRSASDSMPAPQRHEHVVKLFRD